MVEGNPVAAGMIEDMSEDRAVEHTPEDRAVEDMSGDRVVEDTPRQPLFAAPADSTRLVSAPVAVAAAAKIASSDDCDPHSTRSNTKRGLRIRQSEPRLRVIHPYSKRDSHSLFKFNAFSTLFIGS